MPPFADEEAGTEGDVADPQARRRGADFINWGSRFISGFRLESFGRKLLLGWQGLVIWKSVYFWFYSWSGDKVLAGGAGTWHGSEWQERCPSKGPRPFGHRRPPPTPATKRLSGACSPLVRNTRGRVVLNGLQSVWRTPAGLHEHGGDASCGSGQSQPRGGLSFSHIHWDSVISGVRLGPTLCGFHGSST